MKIILVLSPENHLAWQQRLCLFAKKWQADCELVWLGEQDEMKWPTIIQHVHVAGNVKSAKAVSQVLQTLEPKPDLVIFPGTDWSLLQAGYYCGQSGAHLFKNVVTCEDENVLQRTPGGMVRHNLTTPSVITLSEAINTERLSLHRPSQSTLKTNPVQQPKKVNSQRCVLRSIGIGRGVETADLVQLSKWAKQQHWQINGSSGAIDQGKIAADRLLGFSTTKTLRLRTYLALGLSGSSYHLQGLRYQTLLAINHNPKAPIFKHCHVGLISPIQDWLALLSL